MKKINILKKLTGISLIALFAFSTNVIAQNTIQRSASTLVVAENDMDPVCEVNLLMKGHNLFFQIEGCKEIVHKVDVHWVQGRRDFKWVNKDRSENFRIKVYNWKRGLYIVNVTLSNGKVYSDKLYIRV